MTFLDGVRLAGGVQWPSATNLALPGYQGPDMTRSDQLRDSRVNSKGEHHVRSN